MNILFTLKFPGCKLHHIKIFYHIYYNLLLLFSNLEEFIKFSAYGTSSKHFSTSPCKLFWLTISTKGLISSPATMSIQSSSTFITKNCCRVIMSNLVVSLCDVYFKVVVLLRSCLVMVIYPRTDGLCQL